MLLSFEAFASSTALHDGFSLLSPLVELFFLLLRRHGSLLVEQAIKNLREQNRLTQTTWWWWIIEEIGLYVCIYIRIVWDVILLASVCVSTLRFDVVIQEQPVRHTCALFWWWHATCGLNWLTYTWNLEEPCCFTACSLTIPRKLFCALSWCIDWTTLGDCYSLFWD